MYSSAIAAAGCNRCYFLLQVGISFSPEKIEQSNHLNFRKQSVILDYESLCPNNLLPESCSYNYVTLPVVTKESLAQTVDAFDKTHVNVSLIILEISTSQNIESFRNDLDTFLVIQGTVGA